MARIHNGLAPALVAAMAAAVALAGCSGGDGLDDIPVTSDTGGIRGVVVDEAIRPIQGATVQVPAIGKSAITDASGEYAITGLAAGSYVVKASHPLYDVVQQTANVVAGDPDPKAVKFQLTRLITADPYAVTTKYDGFIACSLGVPNVGYSEECGEGVGVPCDVPPPVGCQRVGGQDNNDVQYDFNVDGPSVRSLTVELVWEPSAGETGAGQLYAIVATDWVCDPSCEGNRLGEASGASPLHVYVPPRALGNLSAEKTVTAFTWAAFEDQNAPNPVVNQDYQLFVTASYHLPLPEEWSFVDGDPVPY